jgi:hypothetical protein
MRRARRRVGPPDRRKQGPIQFLENNPIQSSFWVRFMCPKTRRNWLRLPIVRFHPGSSCPRAAALRQRHTRGRRPPPFPRDHALVGIRSTFAVPHLAQSSEHPNTFTSFRRPTLWRLPAGSSGGYHPLSEKACGMRSIGHPDFQYTPWSPERRAAASKAARARAKTAGAKSAAKTPRKKAAPRSKPEGTVNDASRHDGIERRSWYLLWLSPWRRRG